MLKTHNKLLDKYKYAVGIKTGFTNRAGKCLIARAKKDNKDVILVMLKAKADRWTVAENMFEKAFDMQRPEPELIDDDKDDNIATAAMAKRGGKIASKQGSKSKKLSKKSSKTTQKVASKQKVGKKLKVASKTKGDRG